MMTMARLEATRAKPYWETRLAPTRTAPIATSITQTEKTEGIRAGANPNKTNPPPTTTTPKKAHIDLISILTFASRRDSTLNNAKLIPAPRPSQSAPSRGTGKPICGCQSMINAPAKDKAIM